MRCFRAGELTAILVPTKEQGALRDLLRALNGAKRDQISHMHQLAKFLIRQGRHKPEGAGLMSTKYLMWARVQKFEQAAHREVLTHYLLEFEHSTQRLQELNKTLEEGSEQLPKRPRRWSRRCKHCAAWRNCSRCRWSASSAVCPWGTDRQDR